MKKTVKLRVPGSKCCQAKSAMFGLTKRETFDQQTTTTSLPRMGMTPPVQPSYPQKSNKTEDTPSAHIAYHGVCIIGKTDRKPPKTFSATACRPRQWICYAVLLGMLGAWALASQLCQCANLQTLHGAWAPTLLVMAGATLSHSHFIIALLIIITFCSFVIIALISIHFHIVVFHFVIIVIVAFFIFSAIFFALAICQSSSIIIKFFINHFKNS